jgi:hypothetical protein
MPINPSRDYPKISASELSRLTLDEESHRQFSLRFRPALLSVLAIGFAVPLAAWLLGRFDILSEGIAATISTAGGIFGIAIFFWVRHRMMRTRPRSVRTGNEMAPFVINNPEFPNQYEIAYVDDASGTYFKGRYWD